MIVENDGDERHWKLSGIRRVMVTQDFFCLPSVYMAMDINPVRGRIMTDEDNRINGRFQDNPALKGREDKFQTKIVNVSVVLASWRESLFAHEWLDVSGQIKNESELSPKIQLKREEILGILGGDGPISRPVLGIGITDCIEIGAGRDLFLVLASQGWRNISVHIPKSHAKDFKIFST